MAREYGRLKYTFWGRGWSLEQYALGSYLLTSPHTTALGAFRLPEAYVAADLDTSPAEARRLLCELANLDFCVWDQEAQWVWIKKFLLHNPPENPKVWTHVERLAKAVPSAVSFRSDMLAAVRAIRAGETGPPGNPIDTVSERFPNPIDTVVAEPNRTEPNRTEPISSSLLDAARRREPEPPKPAPVDLVCDALGIVWGSGPGHLNWPSQVGELLAMGYSLEGEILPACRDLRQRGSVGSIRAIGRYLRKVLQERAAAAKAAGVLAIEPTDERGWRSRLATFREMGVWPERWGPRIGEPGCLCPPRLATEAA